MPRLLVSFLHLVQEMRRAFGAMSLQLFTGQLHHLITERIKVLSIPTGESSGKFVLYWMHTAVRDAENPALDVALHEAASRKLPLLVCSYLLGSHTYPTHRRYKFLLEGLRDVQIGLRSKVLFSACALLQSSVNLD